jgi:hypothetical protein
MPWQPKNNGPQFSRETSVKMQQFESGRRKSGSLVLSKEDFAIMKLKSKVESTKRHHQRHREAQQDELEILHNVKDTLSYQLKHRLEELELDEYYQQTIQTDYLQDGLDMAPPGDGTQEAAILKAMHRSELYDRVRAKLQEQNSDELMEVYKTLPLIKDECSEKEAEILSKLMKEDSLKCQRQELSEHCLKLQKEIIAKLDTAAEERFQRAHARLQGETEEDDGELTERKESRKAGVEARSYSSRLLGFSDTKETQQALKEVVLKEVVLEEEEQERFKELEIKPTSASHTGTTRTTGRSRNPVPPSQKSPTNTKTTARSRVTNSSRGTSPKPSGRSTGIPSSAPASRRGVSPKPGTRSTESGTDIPSSAPASRRGVSPKPGTRSTESGTATRSAEAARRRAASSKSAAGTTRRAEGTRGTTRSAGPRDTTPSSWSRNTTTRRPATRTTTRTTTARSPTRTTTVRSPTAARGTNNGSSQDNKD